MACLHPLLLLRLSLITIRQTQFSHFLLWKIVASHDQEGNAIVSNEGKDLDVEKDQAVQGGRSQRNDASGSLGQARWLYSMSP